MCVCIYIYIYIYMFMCLTPPFAKGVLRISGHTDRPTGMHLCAVGFCRVPRGLGGAQS